MKLNIKVWNSNERELRYQEVESYELQNAFSFLGIWEILEKELAGNGYNLYSSYTEEMEKMEGKVAGDLFRMRTKNAYSLEKYGYYHEQYMEHLRRANLHGKILETVRALQNKEAKWKRIGIIQNGKVEKYLLKDRLRNSLSPDFLDKNWEKIEQMLEERGNIFQTDMEYTLFLLFIFLHGQANCVIMEDSLDRGEYRQWKDSRFNVKDSVSLMHMLLDQARYLLEDDQLRKDMVLEIAPRRSDVLEFPLYKGQEKLDGMLELIRIEKKRPASPEDAGEPTKVVLKGTGVSMTLAPGETLFALRAGGQYIQFLPGISKSGGFRLTRRGNDPYTLVLCRPDGRRTEMTFEVRPATWAYSPSSDIFVCIDENGCVSSKPTGVCGVRKGVMVSMWDRSCYVLRPDGRVWSNMLGAEKLENIIFLSAGPNCAVFVDAARRVHVLRGGKLECATTGVGLVVGIEWNSGNYRFIY